MSAEESTLLAGLAPLAGDTPRAVKRFVNLYRIARGQAGNNKGSLALFLALFSGGTPDEIGVLRRALAWRDDNAPLDLSGGSVRLTQGLDTAQSLDGLVTVGAARRTAAIARAFSLKAGRLRLVDSRRRSISSVPGLGCFVAYVRSSSHASAGELR